jgi:hypothetical protein
MVCPGSHSVDFKNAAVAAWLSELDAIGQSTHERTGGFVVIFILFTCHYFFNYKRRMEDEMGFYEREFQKMFTDYCAHVNRCIRHLDYSAASTDIQNTMWSEMRLRGLMMPDVQADISERIDKARGLNNTDRNVLLRQCRANLVFKKDMVTSLSRGETLPPMYTVFARPPFCLENDSYKWLNFHTQ